jgi:hypothetical protein
MLMGWHQAICQHIHVLPQIFPDPIQEIQIIFAFHEHGLTVVTAIVEVIILVRNKGHFSAGQSGSWLRLPMLIEYHPHRGDY